MVEVKEIKSYRNYGRVVEISNGVIKALVTVDIGPRVISFGYVDGQNILWDKRELFTPMTDEEYENYYGKGKSWEVLGGHRVWVAPETYPHTYSPDDTAVAYEVSDNTVVFAAAPETENGVAKSLIVRMDPDDANMQIDMNVTNISNSEKEYAVWGVTVCDGGGAVIMPTNDHDSGYVPNKMVAIWRYTNMSDKRIYWGNSYITVTQDSSCDNPLKIGTDLNKGNAYYVLGDDVFCMSYSPNHKNGVYVDKGVSFETYTNNMYLEMETLGELKKVKPQETISHTEHWSLCKKPCDIDFKDDNSIENFLKKI